MLSLEAKFSQIVEALNKANLYTKFKKQFTNLSASTLEVKINASLALLKDAGIVESFVEGGGWGLSFESFRPQNVRKHNGPSDNGREPSIITETRKHDPFAAGDKIMRESAFKRGEITKDQLRTLNGQLSVDGEREFEQLNEGQKAEYNFARMCGVSEADCLRLVKITGGYGSGHSKGWNHNN